MPREARYQTGDYWATHIGNSRSSSTARRTAYSERFINACSRKGRAIVTPFPPGQCEDADLPVPRMVLQVFRRSASALKTKGGCGEAFDRSHYDLTPIAKLDEYRGFIFGALIDECRL